MRYHRDHRKRLQAQSESSSSQLSSQLTSTLAERDELTRQLSAEKKAVATLKQQLEDAQAAQAAFETNANANVRV